MNKYCVIARNFKTYFIKRLSEEVGEGLILFNPWEEETLPGAAIYLFRSSAVYGSNKDLEVLNQIPARAMIFNPAEALNKFRDKKLQYTWPLNGPFKSIPWVSLEGRELAFAEKFVQEHPEVVVKPLRGQQGWGVEKLDISSLKEWWARRSDDEYLLQQFISGVELRLFFIRDEFFLLKRTGQGIAVNFAQGGEAELVPIPDRLREQALLFIQNSGAFYGALDLIFSQDEYHFLELNLSPGIEQLESLSGENIIHKLLQAMNSGT
jgi:glutathione synthase/RimK-type ligase-like ATP-grasp enzyme